MWRDWYETWYETLPEPLVQVVAWLIRPVVLSSLATLSLVTLVLSVVAVPALLAKLPTDHFVTDHPEPWSAAYLHNRLALWAVHLLKNLIGWILALAGLLMLVLPGQGLLTLFVATLFIDFPRKRDIQRWLLRRPWIRPTVDRLRQRAHRPPFELDLDRDRATRAERRDPAQVRKLGS